MPRTGVLFDVDGTLLDTNYLHVVAWARAVRDAGEWAPMSAIHRCIGMGSDRLVEEILGHDNDKAASGHSRYFGELKPEMRAFPKVAELLEAVHERGAMVVLATSANEGDVEEMLEVVDAKEGTVDHVTHAGDVGESKPAPDIFQVAIDATGLEPSGTLVVGDSVWDVEAAARCGLDCVGLLTGGISRQELEEAGAKVVYRDVADLLERLDKSPLARLWDR